MSTRSENLKNTDRELSVKATDCQTDLPANSDSVHSDICRNKQTGFVLCAVAIVSLMTLSMLGAAGYVLGDKDYSSVWQTNQAIPANIDKHIRQANGKAVAAINQRADELKAFLESRKKGCRAFAENTVSLYGKWRVVKPWIPLTDDHSHEAYIKELFAQHIFSGEELGQALKRAVDGAIKDLESIENDLAVALHEEMLGSSVEPNEIPIAKENFKKAINSMVSASQWDATKAAGGLAASEVASTVGMQVLLRMGVSAGILGTGAANSWWSFGGSMALGVLVDMAWTWIDDPVGDIESGMNSAIDTLAENAGSALRDELISIISERNEQWVFAASNF
jgi:hypothetical protein